MTDQHPSTEENAFAVAARQRLEASAQGLDELTRARLRAMRAQAVEQARGRRRWRGGWPAGGLAAAAAVAAVAVLALLMARDPAAPLPVAEPLILGADEQLDLYRDLDFYLWLETRDAPA